MTDRNDHIFIRNHVFDAEFIAVVDDVRSAFISVFISDFNELIPDDLHAKILIREDFLKVLDFRHYLLILFLDLLSLHAGESLQAHVENRLCLYLTQLKVFYQAFFGFHRIGTFPYQFDNSIQIVKSNQQSLKDVCPLLCLRQIVFCSAHHHFMPEINKAGNHCFQ